MKFLDRLCDAYYAGDPLVSNELFDELAKKYNYNKLGTSSETEIRHKYPMWSLSKVYRGESVPFDGGVATPKLDGAAISLLYSGGRLIWASTRGDGISGQDVTDKMATIVPLRVPREDLFQVSGEVVTRLGKDNLRNYSSGALNLKDLEEFKKRDLYFFAYDMAPADYETYTQGLKLLEMEGFQTVATAMRQEQEAGEELWPKDGTVFRLDSQKEYEAAGFTSKHPRGAYALKENKEPEITTLLDITWQVGRSGVISPVAILEPVDVDGAQVSRATLHNWAYIKDLDLEPNCKVAIIRAGEIIPRVVRRIYD